MMEDTGLQGGAAVLRDQELLLDFTIKVQDQEFRVHKFVLASVSDYFRAMICGSLSESMNDMVELKEVNVQLVSDLIDFIYTGKSLSIDKNPKAMLELAVYFQMPKVIEKCRLHLHCRLCVENCVDLLATFKTYSMDKEVKTVNRFIKNHTSEVMRHYEVRDITPDVVQIILDNWSKSEWDMLQFLHSWLSASSEDCEKYANDFMKEVRFSIMTPQQIRNIKEMDWFTKTEGEWKDIVEKAFVLYEQTSQLKVFAHSGQSKCSPVKSPFLLSVGGDGRGKTKFSVLTKLSDKSSFWITCKSMDSPQVTGKISFVLEANNFLITCSEFGENQTWQVFDPQTLSWTEMPNMPKPKDAFAMVYQNKHLYVLGGTTGFDYENSLTDTVDEYNFETNSWSSTKKLPVAVKNHSACVLDGNIYVSGGDVVNDEGMGMTARMDCFNIASQKWETKAPMHSAMANHKMCVMTISMQQAIVVIDNKLEVRYYNAVCDQWSTCGFWINGISMEHCNDKHDYPFKNMGVISWSHESIMLVDGNTIYLLNVPGEEWQDYDSFGRKDPHFIMSKDLCAKWRVDYAGDKMYWMGYEDDESSEEDKASEEQQENRPKRITQYGMSDFPMEQLPNYPPLNVIGGVLAFPANAIRENC